MRKACAVACGFLTANKVNRRDAVGAVSGSAAASPGGNLPSLTRRAAMGMPLHRHAIWMLEI
jgi:hypothetical protein